MNQNIIEYAREFSIKKLFETNGFSTVWPTWKNKIQTDIFNSTPPTEHLIYSIGDNLRDRRTFVLKHNKDLIPSPIKDAITVNYGNFRSNTESDLIAITFPDKAEYTIDKEQILIKDIHGNSVDISKGKNYNFLPILDALVARDFDDIEIHIIQCKTNWNDNAQIPMLWDAVYSANTFRNGISVGTNGYSIHDAKRFTYSFVTVPSNQIEKNGRLTYKNTSTAVLRVLNLSGGNYWGLPSETGVASSIKELLERNLKSGHSNGIISTIRTSMSYLNSTYSYFDII